MVTHPTVFALGPHLAAKSTAVLIARDEEHLAHVVATLSEQQSELKTALAHLSRAPGGRGRGALDRDLEIHRLSGRLGVLQRMGTELCLGRIVGPDAVAMYVGRIGVLDSAGNPLLIDWRTPAAAPFFSATSAHPMGLVSRRRYRWSAGQIVDYWDEVFADTGTDPAALDKDSALIASLHTRRTPKMRDVLATIQADQDAIIRADSAGALVVDGGPGTGKTVVALHRAAFLLYADARLAGAHGGLLFVGPNRHYLRYVSDVLPGLGEDSVLSCTIADLVAEGAHAEPERVWEVARVKASRRLLDAVEPAVGLYEELPSKATIVETPWTDIRLTVADWAEARESVDEAVPHNEARDDIWEALREIAVEIGMSQLDPSETDPGDLRASVSSSEEFRDAFQRFWPILNPTDLVGDLWAVPAYLARCAPWLSDEERRLLRREEGAAWTSSDLPLLDAMTARLGDPKASWRRRRGQAILAEDRGYMDTVVQNLLEFDDDPESPLALLNRDSVRADLLHDEALPAEDRNPLDGPFAHVIVDEAQELTDAEWQMLIRRCPLRSFTIVGDRAQARNGFTESWKERLTRLGFDTVEQCALTINYRTPQEIMDAAVPVITQALPDANVPTSVRVGGQPVKYGHREDLPAVLDRWRAQNPRGVACVIGDPEFIATDRVQSLTPLEVKGLEFDLVVLVDPQAFGSGISGAVDQYVSMTRATQELVVLTSSVDAVT